MTNGDPSLGAPLWKADVAVGNHTSFIGSMGKSQRQPAHNTGNNRGHGGTFATPSGIPEDQCTFSKDQAFNVLRAMPGLTSDFHEHLQRRRKGEWSRRWAMAVTGLWHVLPALQAR